MDLGVPVFKTNLYYIIKSPPLRGGGGGVKTEIFHFRGGLPPHTPRNISPP